MKTLISALMISASMIGAAAHADDDTTRTQVRAELAAARAAGQLDYANDFPPPGISTAPSSVTREQVRAELAAARAAGKLDYANDFPPPGISTAHSGVTRAQVVAELKAAKANGGIDYEQQPDSFFSQHAAGNDHATASAAGKTQSNG